MQNIGAELIEMTIRPTRPWQVTLHCFRNIELATNTGNCPGVLHVAPIQPGLQQPCHYPAQNVAEHVRHSRERLTACLDAPRFLNVIPGVAQQIVDVLDGNAHASSRRVASSTCSESSNQYSSRSGLISCRITLRYQSSSTSFSSPSGTK